MYRVYVPQLNILTEIQQCRIAVGKGRWGEMDREESRQLARGQAQQTLTISFKQKDSVTSSIWQELIYDSCPSR